MKILVKIVGICLILFGIQTLGQNIFFTTNVYPYFWKGLAADVSVISLMIGTIMLVTLPKDLKNLGWTPVMIGIVAVFISSRAILSPTSLWQFFISFMAFTIGYQMATKGRLPL